MASFVPLRPNSRFGVPLTPFPPGCGWRSTLEMVEDVCADLRLPWVQDFMLRSNLRQDAHALNDPANYNRAISNIVKCASVPGLNAGFEGHTSKVRLDIPVLSIDNIGVGIGVENLAVGGMCNGDGFFQENQFFRSVSNNRRNSLLILRVLDLGTVSCHYMVHSKDGLWRTCHLTWEHKSFLKAFDKKSCRVNFQLIHQYLKQSKVAGVQYPRTPTFISKQSSRQRGRLLPPGGLMFICRRAAGAHVCHLFQRELVLQL